MDLDEEEMAVITQKLKKFFKKTKENSKKKNFRKPERNEWDQFTRCFKCSKHDHIVKKFLLLKEEQKTKQFQKQWRKQFGNSSIRRFSKAMLAAWGDTIEDNEASKEEKAAVALMPKSESNSDDKPVDSVS